MSARLALFLLLVAGASNIQAADEPKPRSLIDPQVQGLVKALDDPLVQLEALKWCVEVRADRAVLFEPIRKLCQHDDHRIRNAAVSAITVFGKRGVDVLTDLLNQTEIRREAAKALAGLGKAAATAAEPLTRLLADPDPDTRAVAAEALGGIGEKAIDLLTKLLTGQDIRVRRAAAGALGRIEKEAASAAEPLTKLLTDLDPETRAAAANALGRIGEKAAGAVDILTKLLKDRDPATRRAAANALGQIGQAAASAAEPLTKLLTDPEFGARLAAAYALGRIGEQAVKPLTNLLIDQDILVRRAAAEVLGQIGQAAASAAEPLTKLLTDPDPGTRAAAATALGWIGQVAAGAVKPLTKLLTDRDPATRRAAAVALGQLGEKAASAVDLLTNLLNYRDLDTGPAAADALARIGEKVRFKAATFLAVFRAPEIGPANRRPITILLRRNSNTSPGDLCELLELAHGRYDQRSDRILDAYLIARDEERPLVCWLGGRRETDLPSFDRLQHDDAAKLIRQFTALLPHTTRGSGIRKEIADRMDFLSKKTSWSFDDLKTLQSARDALSEAEMPEGTALGNRIESLDRWRKAIEYLKATSAIWAGHVLFWVALVAVYPYSRWVQAIFFWNPWVRRITGLVYVPLVITLVPFLRRRLLRPFQPNLIPDRFQHEFEEDSYFAQSRITATRDGHPVTRFANEYLKPPLRGPRVIQAPSGYGKTTLLQWFVRQPGDPRVVLRAAECDQGVMKAIQQCVQGIARDEAFLQTLVFSGGLDVIIDGLNEASPETRGQIGTFVDDHFRGNYLLTTQPLLGYKIPRAAELWKLQPLAPDQVQAFLLGRWPRVNSTAAAHAVSHDQYEAAVRKLLEDVDPQAEPAQFSLATPLDAALVADLIVQNVEPDLNNLIAQHVSLDRASFRESAPAREPAFERVGERALEMTREQKPKLDLAGLERECDALLKRKLLISHGTDYSFRHDRIRDYFMALSIHGVEEALALRQDARFTGAFEFLSETLEKSEADELGEILKKEAADTADNRVWSKYKLRWDQPGRFERIEDLIQAATTHFHVRSPGETPNFVGIGERVIDAIQTNSSPNWTHLEREVEGLLAARVMRQGLMPNEPARFRTEDLRWYFVALYLASPGLLDRAKELSTDDRFTGLFGFLPRLLGKLARDELGKYLEKTSNDAKKAGKNPCPSWEQYRRTWRRRKSAGL
jgi:HEAT repeat protein